MGASKLELANGSFKMGASKLELSNGSIQIGAFKIGATVAPFLIEGWCHRFRHDEDDFPADLWVVPLSSLNLSVKGHDQHIKLLGVYSSKMTFAPKVTKFFL